MERAGFAILSSCRQNGVFLSVIQLMQTRLCDDLHHTEICRFLSSAEFLFSAVISFLFRNTAGAFYRFGLANRVPGWYNISEQVGLKTTHLLAAAGLPTVQGAGGKIQSARR